MSNTRKSLCDIKNNLRYAKKENKAIKNYKWKNSLFLYSSYYGIKIFIP